MTATHDGQCKLPTRNDVVIVFGGAIVFHKGGAAHHINAQGPVLSVSRI